MYKKCLMCSGISKLLYKNLYDDRYGAPGKYNIYRCKVCGFGQIDPKIPLNKVGQFYAKYYPLSQVSAEAIKNSVKIQARFRSWWEGADGIAYRQITPGSIVLDVGSGTGRSLLEIKLLGGDAYGVEPDPNAQRIAKELKLNLKRGFITDPVFPEIKFDFVTANQVLEHDPDPVRFLKAVNKKLKTGGKAVLSFPNTDAFYRRIFGRRWIHWHVPYHCNFFTKKSIRKLAGMTGFKINKIKTATPNLWTSLQLSMLSVKVREGQKSPVWDQSGKKSGSMLDFYFSRVQLFIISFINRILDGIGHGEGFLVVLEKIRI